MKRLFLIFLILLFTRPAFAALTKTTESLDDWTAVAQNTVVEGTTLDTSDHYSTEIHIQAFLDTTTAHTGTNFIVQISGNSAGNEDWEDYTKFSALIDTANSEAITDNPLGAASTTINVADTGGNYEATEPTAKWLAIEGAALANSELIYETAFTTDTDITILDGTTNEHAQGVLLWDVAISRTILIGFPVYRCRVIVDNTLDSNGSTLNVKVRATAVTGI
jgi:hypothetical protein